MSQVTVNNLSSTPVSFGPVYVSGTGAQDPRAPMQLESGEVCTCECVFAGVRAILRVHGVFLSMDIYICMYMLCIYIYMYMYIYLYVYVCTCICIYTHPHIHIHRVPRHVFGVLTEKISHRKWSCRRMKRRIARRKMHGSLNLSRAALSMTILCSNCDLLSKIEEGGLYRYRQFFVSLAVESRMESNLNCEVDSSRSRQSCPYISASIYLLRSKFDDLLKSQRQAPSRSWAAGRWEELCPILASSTLSDYTHDTYWLRGGWFWILKSNLQSIHTKFLHVNIIFLVFSIPSKNVNPVQKSVGGEEREERLFWPPSSHTSHPLPSSGNTEGFVCFDQKHKMKATWQRERVRERERDSKRVRESKNERRGGRHPEKDLYKMCSPVWQRRIKNITLVKRRWLLQNYWYKVPALHVLKHHTNTHTHTYTHVHTHSLSLSYTHTHTNTHAHIH